MQHKFVTNLAAVNSSDICYVFPINNVLSTFYIDLLWYEIKTIWEEIPN